MSLTVRKFSAQVRDSTTGEMIPAGLLSSDALGAIDTAKNTAVAAVQAQGATTIASIPSDYTSLSNEVDDLKSALSQMSEISDDLRSKNLFPPTRKTTTGNVSITPVEYSGIQLSGTIPYHSNVVLTNWTLNLSPGTYTLYVASKNNVDYPSDFNFDIFNVSGMLYPVRQRDPLVFTVSSAVSNSAIRFYLNNASYSNGFAVNDTLFIYLVSGEHTLADFARIKDVERKITSVSNPFGMAFEHGTINNTTGADSDYYKYARARSEMKTFPFPVDISMNSGSYMVLYYAYGGDFLGATGWKTTEITTIDAKQPFRLMLSFETTVNTYTSLDLMVASLTVASTQNIDLYEKGSIADGANNAYNQAARARTKNICVHDFDLEISTDNGAFIVFYFNADNSYAFRSHVNDWIRNKPYIIPAGLKYRLLLSLDPTSSSSVPLGTILNSFKFRKLETRYSDKLKLLRSLKYHFNIDENTQGTWTNHNHNNLFTIAHISDVHTDVVRYKNFLNFYKNNSSLIDAAIQSGDILDAPTEEQIAIMHSVDPNNEIIWCTGNHEIAGNDGTGTVVTTTLANLYTKFGLTTNTGKLYHYVDFAEKHIRLIVLNAYNADNNSVNWDYKATQLQWLVNTLKDAANNNLSVLIAMHLPESEVTPNSKGFYARFYQWTGLGDNYGTYSAVEDIIDAFVNGASVTTTFYNGSITADFTGYSGNFIAYITGHRHQDTTGYSSEHPNQLYLNIVCGAVNQGYGRKSQNFTAVSDLPRIEGTETENAFNVYGIDLDNRIIKVIRVGSDMNDLMEDRNKATYTF